MAGYTEEKFCKTVQKMLPLREDCAEINGLLFIDGRLVIPDEKGLQKKLNKEAHARLGHLGYLKTIMELHPDFFWPQMTKHTTNLVQSCDTSQKTKAPTTAPTGKMLTPLLDIAIDFVGPLKASIQYDMILTCTCPLLGFTRIIPALQTDTAERSATRLFNGVVTHTFPYHLLFHCTFTGIYYNITAYSDSTPLFTHSHSLKPYPISYWIISY
jgi:hypothetical protein